jgi:hypothetical protein
VVVGNAVATGSAYWSVVVVAVLHALPVADEATWIDVAAGGTVSGTTRYSVDVSVMIAMLLRGV